MTKMHKTITDTRVYRAVELTMFGMENAGFCLECGADADGCEPDARNYKCHACGLHRVFGAEEVMLMRGI